MIAAKVILALILLLSLVGMTCILVDMIKNPERVIVIVKRKSVPKTEINNDDVEINEDVFEIDDVR